eukprot:11541837-Alexandrium_andersonii.AAC.1
MRQGGLGQRLLDGNTFIATPRAACSGLQRFAARPCRGAYRPHGPPKSPTGPQEAVSYTHLRAHETSAHL